MDVIQIDNNLGIIFEKAIYILKTNQYLNNPVNKQDFLRVEYDDLYYKIDGYLKDLPVCDYLIEKTDLLISELEKEIITKKSSFQQKTILQKTRISLFAELKHKLQEYLRGIILNMAEVDADNEKLTDHGLLKRSEISLLMLYLREVGAISRNVSDTDLSNHFSGLTGFSAKTLRRDTSGLAKFEKNEITVKEENYDKVIELLNEVISRIEKDKAKINLK